MTKFRKKPVVIEAFQLRWTQWSEVCDFLGDIISEENPARTDALDYSDKCGEDGPYLAVTIPTPEGNMVARHGDWIIKGVKGEFYPCKPDIFEATYEDAELFAEVDEAPGVLEGEIHAALKRLNKLVLTATAEGRSPDTDLVGGTGIVTVELRGPDWWSDGEGIVRIQRDKV